MRINDTGDTDVGEENAVVPAGWKFVPEKLTPAMRSILKEAAPRWNAESIYAGLLDEAPAPPSQALQQAGALTDEQIHSIARVSGMYEQHDNACPSKSTVEYFVRNILAVAAGAQ